MINSVLKDDDDPLTHLATNEQALHSQLWFEVIPSIFWISQQIFEILFNDKFQFCLLKMSWKNEQFMVN